MFPIFEQAVSTCTIEIIDVYLPDHPQFGEVVPAQLFRGREKKFAFFAPHFQPIYSDYFPFRDPIIIIHKPFLKNYKTVMSRKTSESDLTVQTLLTKFQEYFGNS